MVSRPVGAMNRPPAPWVLWTPLLFGAVLGWPGVLDLLWPLGWWVTGLHESCHALAAWLTGGQVVSIGLDGQAGLTTTRGGWYPVISAAGYVGTAATGALLLRSTHWSPRARIGLLLAVATGPAVFLMVYGQWGLSWLVALLVAVGMAVTVRRTQQGLAGFLAALLFWQTWEDLRVYVWAIPAHTDAGLLARYWHAPWLTLPIAVLYAGLSLAWWAWAVRGWWRQRKGGRASQP